MSKLEYKLTASWETEHDTANGIMTHTFDDRHKVVSNLRTGEIKVFSNGIIEQVVDGSKMSVNEYTEFVSELAEHIAVNAVINDLVMSN